MTAVCLAVVVGVAVTLDVLNGGLLTQFDHVVSRVMWRWGVRFDTWPLRGTYLLTLFGQRGTVLVLTVPLVGFLVWRSRSSGPALHYLLALVLLTVAVYALKGWTGRSAPPHDALHTAAGASFPSGHVANALIVWGTVSWTAARVAGVPTWLCRSLRVMPVLAPTCVFVGMTILDYHWFTDFVVGACLGVVLLWMVLLPGWDRVITGVDRVVPGLGTADRAPSRRDTPTVWRR